jgi:hypothetical protein
MGMHMVDSTGCLIRTRTRPLLYTQSRRVHGAHHQLQYIKVKEAGQLDKTQKCVCVCVRVCVTAEVVCMNKMTY